MKRENTDNQRSTQALACSIKETAAMFAVTPQHIRNMIARGQIHTIRLGTRVLITTDEIERLLEGSR